MAKSALKNFFNKIDAERAALRARLTKRRADAVARTAQVDARTRAGEEFKMLLEAERRGIDTTDDRAECLDWGRAADPTLQNIRTSIARMEAELSAG